MARAFDGAGDNITDSAGAEAIDVDSKTWFCWVLMGDITNARALWTDASTISSGNFRFFVSNDSAGAEERLELTYNWTGTNGAWSADGGNIGDSAWHCGIIAYDRALTTNNPLMWVDGVAQTVGEDSTPTTAARTGIAAWRSGENVGSGSDFTGEESYLTIWGVELTDNQALILSRGVNPFAVLNSDILMCCPFNGNDSLEPDYSGGGLVGTVNNATKASTNPPIELIENYL